MNPNSAATKVFFEYGSTEEYGTTKEAAESPLMAQSDDENVTLAVDDLKPGTQYFFRTRSENEKGVTYGEQRVFTTLGKAPVVLDVIASNVGPHSMVVYASVLSNNLETTVMVEYGTDLDFMHSLNAPQGPLNSSKEEGVVIDIPDLHPGQKYFLRIKATNELGTEYSETIEVTTAGGKPIIDDLFIMETQAKTVKLELWVYANQLATALNLEYSTSYTFGNPQEINYGEFKSPN